jgi:hypothetical protein
MAEPSPWDNKGMAGTLADAIRNQARVQAQMASNGGVSPLQQQSSIAPVNPLEQLAKQIQGINVASTPLDMLRQQASSTVAPQYDQMIRALQAQMGQTKERATNNQATAKQMYGDLATDIAAQIPEITNQMAQASQETENRYNDTQAQLQGQYNQQQEQQAALLKNLGIQAAAPEASQQAMEDQAYFQNQSRSDEANALQMLKEMGQSDVAYQNQSANNTRLAGNNAAADIGAQLEQYLQGAQGELNNLNFSKQDAITSMLTQLQQQDSQRVQQQEQQEYGRLMDMFNLQMQMQAQTDKANTENNVSSLFKGTNGMSGTANYLDEVYGGDSFTKNNIADLINNVMSDPTVIAGKYQSPDMKDAMGNPVMMDVNDNYMIDLLRKQMQQGDPNRPLSSPNYSDYDMNNAINGLLARLGRLK